MTAQRSRIRAAACQQWFEAYQLIRRTRRLPAVMQIGGAGLQTLAADGPGAAQAIGIWLHSDSPLLELNSHNHAGGTLRQTDSSRRQRSDSPNRKWKGSQGR